MLKRLVFLFLVLIIIGNVVISIVTNWKDLSKRFDFRYWQFRYLHSQWVPAPLKCVTTNAHINPYTCAWDDNWFVHHPKLTSSLVRIPIGDDGLYMYAGAAYMKGTDPTLLNAEIPPFGKYVLGFLETTFGYNSIFNIFFAGLSLILYFLLNKVLFKSPLLAIIPVALFSFEPLFIEQIKGSYMDTMYLSLLFLAFIFFLKKKYMWSGVFAGLFMATKAPFLVILLAMTFGFFYVMQGVFLKYLKKLALLFTVAVAVFVATYARTFMLGHTIGYFLQAQKYIIHFYQSGAKGVIGAVIPMLFLGEWHKWFGSMQKVTEWSILWPLSTLGSIFAFFVRLRNKDGMILFQLLWVVFYGAFLFVTPIYARYLLLLLPFLYNLSIWSLSVVIKQKFFLD